MIVEELISRIGFEIAGNDFRKVQRAIKQFHGNLNRSTKEARKNMIALGVAGPRAEKGLDKFSGATKTAAKSGTALATIMRGLATVAVSMATRIGGVITLVGGLAYAWTQSARAAAEARREYNLTAQAIGTSAQKLDSLQTMFRGLDFSAENAAEKARGIAAAIAEAREEARTGKGKDHEEALARLKALGLPVDGTGRDTSEDALTALLRYEAATKKAAAAEARRAKNAEALRREADKLAEALDLSKEDQLRMQPYVGRFEQRLFETASMFPTRSNRTEERDARIAERSKEIGLKWEAMAKGVGERYGDIKAWLAENYALPALGAFTDRAYDAAKHGYGPRIIGETIAERDARQEVTRGKALGRLPQREKLELDIETTRRRLDQLRGEPKSYVNQRDIMLLSERIRMMEMELAKEPARPGGAPGAHPLPPARPTDRRSDAAPRGAPLAAALRENLGWFLKLPDVAHMLSPEVQARKVAGDFAAARGITSYDHRQNFNNDQRTQTVTVQQTVHGAEGAARGAAAAVKSVLGATTVKGANTTTGSMTEP